MTDPATLTDLANALRTGELDLMAYLDRLEAHFNRREPQVLAFVPEENHFQRVRQAARDLLARYPEGEKRPFLFGVPIGVKDIFPVDGLPTRAGSQLPPDLWADAPEAPSVTALRRHGALVLGKTVTTEFAYFGPGPTRNPHNPDHTPGGSSSGSAAAVAAGLCPFAFGTQTIGSVNRPAAFCGVVGYKPSYDRISKENVIPLSPSLDHVGFIVPAAKDVALVAQLLCKAWDSDVAPTRNPVLGIPESPYLARATDEGLLHFRRTAVKLANAGYDVKSVKMMSDFDAIYERHNRIVAAEAAAVHREWFAEYGDRYHPKTVELIERGQQVSPEQLQEDLKGREQLRRRLTDLMDSHGIDLWISPAAPGPAPAGLGSTGDPVMNLPWTHSGLPTLTLPSGWSDNGLPLGLQLTGQWYGDEKMLSWAVAIETITGV